MRFCLVEMCLQNKLPPENIKLGRVKCFVHFSDSLYVYMALRGPLFHRPDCTTKV